MISFLKRLGIFGLRKSIILTKTVKKLVVKGFRTIHKKPGLNLIGYFSYTSGVAEVGRFFTQRLKKSLVPFLIYDIEAPSYKKLDSINFKEYKPYLSTRTIYNKNIFFINADAIPYIKQQNPYLFIGRYNIAVFFWEFNDYFNFPEAFIVIDEVIAFTDFIATAVRKTAPSSVKVTKLDFPFIKNWEINKSPALIRNELDIDENQFVFIFNFDFHSVYERKNPEAILKAFEIAFSAMDNVRLILKSIHAEENSGNFKKFQFAVRNMKIKDKIIVINENLSRNEFMSMINAADCYVSLHRSEGLGLGMMEAMSMGKPVIATRYGGNTDFMHDDNSLLVSYKLIPVQEGAEPYKPGWLWADADVYEAAEYMQKLYKDRIFCNDLGKRAEEYISNHYSQDAFLRNLNF